MADARAVPDAHGATRTGRLICGIRLALTTFTVLPLPAGPVNRQVAAVAMSVAAPVGAALGAVLAGVALLLQLAGAPPLLCGFATVAAAALLTRGLHVDGLADTVDALGSYRSGAAALEIMKKPDVGPFGVAALVLLLPTQAAAVAALTDRPWPALVAGVVTATATGRLAVTMACRRGVPAARPDGLGALVAGTVHPAVLPLPALAVVALAVPAVPGRTWQGPLVVLVASAVTYLLLRHVVRRLGGVTGDVLGAAVEVTTALVYVGLVLTG